MLDHVGDLAADFRAFYGIDIHRATTEDLTGPEFFSLARRVFAYEGVMAARWREQEEGGSQHAPARYEPAERKAVAGRQGADVVDLTAFRAMFPDVVEHTETREVT